MKSIFSFILIVFICNTTNSIAKESFPKSSSTANVLEENTGYIPVIYSTDLFHPPEDPDDHYDLAILSSIKEFNLKAVIFDLSTARRTPEEIGLGALQQMSAITDKPIPPWAIGLRDPLISQDDKAKNQPEEFQAGVELILKTLRESNKKVVMFLVGSCRDFAVAFNREPKLLRQKVSAVYVNAGNGPDGIQFEWNVMLDPYAYLTLMKSGLPIYWSPCFSQVNLRPATPEEVIEGEVSTFNTYFIVPDQAKLLENASDILKNFFSYALYHVQGDPLQYLRQTLPEPLPKTARNMWCTGPFLHAAGREIYYHNSKYISCTPQEAKRSGISGQKVDVYQFNNVRLTQTDKEYTIPANPFCLFLGCMFDKTGINDLATDGLPDCHIRLNSLNENLQIEKVIISDSEGLLWKSPLVQHHRAMLLERNGEQLDCFFSPGANGEYNITVYFNNGTQQRYSCIVNKEPIGPVFKGDFEDRASPVNVFRYVNPAYNSIMVSVLSELLGEL